MLLKCLIYKIFICYVAGQTSKQASVGHDPSPCLSPADQSLSATGENSRSDKYNEVSNWQPTVEMHCNPQWKTEPRVFILRSLWTGWVSQNVAWVLYASEGWQENQTQKRLAVIKTGIAFGSKCLGFGIPNVYHCSKTKSVNKALLFFVFPLERQRWFKRKDLRSQTPRNL